MNLYVYCVNNPVYYVDPSGHIICKRMADIIRTKLANGKKVSKQEKLELAAYDSHQLTKIMKAFNQITSPSRKQKGNFGEICADFYLRYSSTIRAKGFELVPIGREAPSGLNDKMVQGIDGIYKNMNPDSKYKYVINEAKFGSSELRITKRSGQQMSKFWLTDKKPIDRDRITKCIRGGRVDQKQQDQCIKDIYDAIENDQVLYIESKIDKNGKVTCTELTPYKLVPDKSNPSITTIDYKKVQKGSAWP